MSIASLTPSRMGTMTFLLALISYCGFDCAPARATRQKTIRNNLGRKCTLRIGKVNRSKTAIARKENQLRLDASVSRNCAARRNFVNNPAFHHEYYATNSGNVFQRIAIEGNDVCLQTRGDGADLVCH